MDRVAVGVALGDSVMADVTRGVAVTSEERETRTLCELEERGLSDGAELAEVTTVLEDDAVITGLDVGTTVPLEN